MKVLYILGWSAVALVAAQVAQVLVRDWIRERKMRRFIAWTTCPCDNHTQFDRNGVCHKCGQRRDPKIKQEDRS